MAREAVDDEGRVKYFYIHFFSVLFTSFYLFWPFKKEESMKDAIRGIFEFFDTDRKGYINASQMRFVEINFSLSTLKKYFDNI